MRRSLALPLATAIALLMTVVSNVRAQTAVSAPSERVETTTYGGWTVSCSQILQARARKTCSAVFRVATQNGQVLLVWLIGLDNQGKLASVIRVPLALGIKDTKTGAVATGLLVAKGAELELGRVVHHLAYSTCAPQWCEAFTQMDDSFIKNASSAASAAVIVYVATGAAINYNALSIKGIDKVLVSVRR
jgi:invasion protein IalB